MWKNYGLGLMMGLVVYCIIKASKNNPRVIKKLVIIAMSISIILILIIVFFLLKVLIRFN